jgi:WD40 repeat protein
MTSLVTDGDSNSVEGSDMTSRRRWLPCACLAVLLAVPDRGRPQGPDGPMPARKDRTDLHGDLLPDGAIARLGTIRFRHPDRVRVVAFSPDGKMIASACLFDHNYIYLWDASTGTAVCRIEPPGGWARGPIAFSPDGKVLASGGDPLCLWEVCSGRNLFRLKNAGDEWHTALAFSPDGRLLASGSQHSAAKGGTFTTHVETVVDLWEVGTGRKIHRLQGFGEPVESLSFAPDGKTLATASYDKTLRLWDVETGEELYRIGQKRALTRIAFAPDGKTLASGDLAGKVGLWDVNQGTERVRFQAHDERVTSLEFTADGRTLLTGAESSTVRLWDPATGKELPRKGDLPPADRFGTFAPDGETLALWGRDCSIRLWDTVTWREKQPRDGHGDYLDGVAVAPDNKTLATASGDGIRVWEAATGRQRHWLRPEEPGTCRGVALSPDGRTIAGATGRLIQFWDAGTGRALRSIPTDGSNFGVAFSPDGQVVYSASLSTVQCWDLTTGETLRTFARRPDTMDRLRFPTDLTVSADGQRVLMFAADGQLRMWDTADGQLIPVPDDLREVAAPIAFSRDGRTLAFVVKLENEGASICLWEVASAQVRCRIPIGRLRCHSIAFSPDGRHLAATCTDGTCPLWATATGKEVAVLRDPRITLWSVVFAPSGRFVVTDTSDTTALVWDVARVVGK